MRKCRNWFFHRAVHMVINSILMSHIFFWFLLNLLLSFEVISHQWGALELETHGLALVCFLCVIICILTFSLQNFSLQNLLCRLFKTMYRVHSYPCSLNGFFNWTYCNHINASFTFFLTSFGHKVWIETQLEELEFGHPKIAS